MGVILQGILGGFSGKVGPVVGGKWKDIDYMRSYVVPANPNTSSQQAVRAKFASMVSKARDILSVILQPFWDPFYSNQSGFNAFISQNYALADSDGILDENAIMTKGTLESASGLACTYNTGTGVCDASFSGNVSGNGLATDLLIECAYDAANDVLYAALSGDTRSAEGTSLTIPAGLTATEVFFFLGLYRGTGAELIVADSIGVQCSAS